MKSYMVEKGAGRGAFTRERQERRHKVWKRLERKAKLQQGWTCAPLESSKIMPEYRKGLQGNETRRLV